MTAAHQGADLATVIEAAEDARTSIAAPGDRRAALGAIADAVEERGDQVVTLAAAETNLSEPRLRGELLRTTNQLRSFADALVDGGILGAAIDLPSSDSGPDVRSVLLPIGVVAVFAASNFPLAFSVVGGDTASALAAGCPVVVKAHPGHPELSNLIARIVLDAVGPGLVQVVHGLEEGLDLLIHPLVRAASFTGSIQGARALQARIGERLDPIPFYGELGSINPVVVTPGAAASRGAEIADQLAASFTQSAGQLCTKPGLVLVPSGSGLAEGLATSLSVVEGQLMLTPGIRDRFNHGVGELAGSERVAVGYSRGSSGVEVLPVVFVVRAGELPDLALEEIFGPATVLVEYDDLEELLAVVRRVAGSLTGTLQTSAEDDPVDVRRALHALSEVSGRVIHNGWPTGVAVVGSMNHGGPWPSSTSIHTSVGITAVHRFQRPLCFQDMPDVLLPPELQDANPLGILRLVNGVPSRAPVARSADA